MHTPRAQAPRVGPQGGVDSVRMQSQRGRAPARTARASLDKPPPRHGRPRESRFSSDGMSERSFDIDHSVLQRSQGWRDFSKQATLCSSNFSVFGKSVDPRSTHSVPVFKSLSSTDFVRSQHPRMRGVQSVAPSHSREAQASIYRFLGRGVTLSK